MDIGRGFFNNSFLEGSVCRETSESEVIFVPDSVYCWSGDSTHKYFVFVIGQLCRTATKQYL